MLCSRLFDRQAPFLPSPLYTQFCNESCTLNFHLIPTPLVCFFFINIVCMFGLNFCNQVSRFVNKVEDSNPKHGTLTFWASVISCFMVGVYELQTQILHLHLILGGVTLVSSTLAFSQGYCIQHRVSINVACAIPIIYKNLITSTCSCVVGASNPPSRKEDVECDSPKSVQTTSETCFLVCYTCYNNVGRSRN